MSEPSLEVSHVGDVTVVDFRHAGVLDSAGVRDVEERLYGLVDEEKRCRLLLDFTEVRFLASRMLGVLVSLHKKAAEQGGMVVLCGLADNLLKVFQVSRLDGVLAFAPTVADGHARFAGESDQVEAAMEALAAAPAQPGWKRAVNRQVRIFVAGAMVLIPLAITVWSIWWIGTAIDDLGRLAFRSVGATVVPPRGTGALVLIAAIYLIGLLTHLWLFRGVFALMERLVLYVPGVKTIYESVRDLMQLFGGGSDKMGRVVQYQAPDSDMAMLGILTNENPLGVPPDSPSRKVSVYVPFSYMIGGPTYLVSPDQIVEVDMSVEECMKICATAQVGTRVKK